MLDASYNFESHLVQFTRVRPKTAAFLSHVMGNVVLLGDRLIAPKKWAAKAEC
jgi:hypothetical protein